MRLLFIFTAAAIYAPCYSRTTVTPLPGTLGLGYTPSPYHAVVELRAVEQTGLIQVLRPANKRRCYFVTTSYIGWAQTWNQPWISMTQKVKYLGFFVNFNAASNWAATLPLHTGCITLIARLMGPTWGPFGADRTQVGLMLAPWTLLSG